jgi:hypothetical protein
LDARRKASAVTGSPAVVALASTLAASNSMPCAWLAASSASSLTRIAQATYDLIDQEIDLTRAARPKAMTIWEHIMEN